MQDGKLFFTYNLLGQQRTTLASKQALPAGKAIIVFQFDYDGGGIGKGGNGSLLVNGEEVARGRIERIQPLIYSSYFPHVGRRICAQLALAGDGAAV